jgi:hypothetical protein
MFVWSMWRMAWKQWSHSIEWGLKHDEHLTIFFFMHKDDSKNKLMKKKTSRWY